VAPDAPCHTGAIKIGVKVSVPAPKDEFPPELTRILI